MTTEEKLHSALDQLRDLQAVIDDLYDHHGVRFTVNCVMGGRTHYAHIEHLKGADDGEPQA